MPTNTFHWADYLIFVLTLVISAAIGIAIQNKFTRGSYLQTNEYPNAVTLCHDILFILFTLSILITN
jgi:hypothetical protein